MAEPIEKVLLKMLCHIFGIIKYINLFAFCLATILFQSLQAFSLISDKKNKRMSFKCIPHHSQCLYAFLVGVWTPVQIGYDKQPLHFIKKFNDNSVLYHPLIEGLIWFKLNDACLIFGMIFWSNFIEPLSVLFPISIDPNPKVFYWASWLHFVNCWLKNIKINYFLIGVVLIELKTFFELADCEFSIEKVYFIPKYKKEMKYLILRRQFIFRVKFLWSSNLDIIHIGVIIDFDRFRNGLSSWQMYYDVYHKLFELDFISWL